MKRKNIGNEKPEIGDLVWLKNEDKTLFIVLHKEEYSDDEVSYLNYEIIRVHPVRNKLKPFEIDGNDVKLYEKMGTDSYKIKMALINKERENKGLGEGEYVEIIKSYLDSLIDESIIDYSNIKTVDGCLDAINDLELLYNKFKDKEYLKNKKAVIERLESLRS